MDLPILTSAQMRAAEQAAFASGVQVEALMNKAGAGIAQAVTKFFQKPGRCMVFAGKGHNAGDALFAAQCLEQRGWKIEVRLAFKEADCSHLMRQKLADLCRRPPEILGAVPSTTADLDTTLVELSPDATE
ncbi:MAG: NAD(P)H-hydrate epimerase, partial [Pseudolabrys sp.]